MTDLRTSTPANLRRVLIIMPQLLGDLVLATSLFTALKARVPQCTIDVLTYERNASILDGHPHIGRIFVIGGDWRRKGLLRTLGPRLKLLHTLREHPYDLLIQSPHTTDGSWGPALIVLLGVPQAVGAHASTHGSPMKRLFWKHTFTHMLPRPHPGQGSRHTAELHLDLLRRMGIHPDPGNRGASIIPNAAAELRVRQLLQDRALQAKGFLLFAPTAGASGRFLNRPMARTLISGLAERGERVVVTAAPTPPELEYVGEVTHDLPGVHNLAGALSLQELAALAQHAECFIGTDSGAMHIAAAMGAPVIACFGPGDETIFGPWHTQARVVAMPWPCRPCDTNGCGGGGIAECMTALSADAVLSALSDIRRHKPVA